MQDLRDMAEAAGQSFPGFTPPEGETQEQVRLEESCIHSCYFIICIFIFYRQCLFCLCPPTCVYPLFLSVSLAALSVFLVAQLVGTLTQN